MTKKVISLEQFYQFAEETFGFKAASINWGFANGRYTEMFGGPPDAENFWMWREFLRSYQHPHTGKSIYTQVVWYGSLVPIPNHFVHVSSQESGMVTYVPNAEKGKKDVRVRMLPGKYLRKFYPDMSEDDVRRWANIHRDLHTDEDVKFAVTREEIREVYMNGPSSCMTHDADVFACRPIHPVEVYGASPTAVVAYLDRESGISGRCLCDIGTNPPRYSRIYGDDVLRAKLERLGFVAATEGLVGMKLAKLTDKFGRIVMPYVDWCTGANFDGEFFTLDKKGTTRIQSTGGMLRSHNTCPNCGMSDVANDNFVDMDLDDGRRFIGCTNCQPNYVGAYDDSGVLVTVLDTEADYYDRLNIYMVRGVSPSALGYVMLHEEWGRADQIVNTINGGQCFNWQTYVQVATASGDPVNIYFNDVSGLSLSQFAIDPAYSTVVYVPEGLHDDSADAARYISACDIFSYHGLLRMSEYDQGNYSQSAISSALNYALSNVWAISSTWRLLLRRVLDEEYVTIFHDSGEELVRHYRARTITEKAARQLGVPSYDGELCVAA